MITGELKAQVDKIWHSFWSGDVSNPLTVIELIILQILEDRYEKMSTVICSQLPVANWYEYLDEPTIADAILDRLVPKAHRLELTEKSLRKKSKHLS